MLPAISMKKTMTIAAALLCSFGGTQADSSVHYGPRASLTFDMQTLTTFLAIGAQHAAVYFADMTPEQRKETLHEKLSDPNSDAVQFYIDYCDSAGALALANNLEKQCGKNCPDDHDIIVSFGTLPGEDFVKDGILHLACAVVKWPKKCNQENSQCDSSLVKPVKADFVIEMVKQMRQDGRDAQMITSPVTTLKAMKDTLIAWAKKSGKNISLPK